MREVKLNKEYRILESLLVLSLLCLAIIFLGTKTKDCFYMNGDSRGFFTDVTTYKVTLGGISVVQDDGTVTELAREGVIVVECY